MRFRRFAIAGGLIVLLAVGIYFFVSPRYPAGSLVCGPGPCIVPVVVKEGCVPVPTFDPIIVEKAHGATKIVWEAPTGYTFTDPDGIKFKDTNADLDPRPGRTNAGARWQVVSNPAHTARIRYRVQVETNGKPPCTGPDPIIWNQ